MVGMVGNRLVGITPKEPERTLISKNLNIYHVECRDVTRKRYLPTKDNVHT